MKQQLLDSLKANVAQIELAMFQKLKSENPNDPRFFRWTDEAREEYDTLANTHYVLVTLESSLFEESEKTSISVVNTLRVLLDSLPK